MEELGKTTEDYTGNTGVGISLLVTAVQCLNVSIGLSLQAPRVFFTEMDLLVLSNSVHMKPGDC